MSSSALLDRPSLASGSFVNDSSDFESAAFSRSGRALVQAGEVKGVFSRKLLFINVDHNTASGVAAELKHDSALFLLQSRWHAGLVSLEIIPHRNFDGMPLPLTVARGLVECGGNPCALGLWDEKSLKKALKDLFRERLGGQQLDSSLAALEYMQLLGSEIAIFPRKAPALCAALAAEVAPFVVARPQSFGDFKRKIDVFLPQQLLEESCFKRNFEAWLGTLVGPGDGWENASGISNSSVRSLPEAVRNPRPENFKLLRRKPAAAEARHEEAPNAFNLKPAEDFLMSDLFPKECSSGEDVRMQALEEKLRREGKVL